MRKCARCHKDLVGSSAGFACYIFCGPDCAKPCDVCKGPVTFEAGSTVSRCRHNVMLEPFDFGMCSVCRSPQIGARHTHASE